VRLLPLLNLKDSSQGGTLKDVAKLGGLIGAVLGFLLPFVVFDHISVFAHDTSTWSDYAGTAVAIAVAVGGWFVGSRTAGWLKARFARSHTVAH
jgi:hypothetical protein